MPDVTGVLDRLRATLSDRYRFERELGAGGMATVYLAEDLKHQRMVALKVLRPELSAVLGAERFLKEIQVTANLQHPHLLPLFDSGEADGLLYYVMPFIEGESLRAKLARERQLPVAEAVRIATQVASALDYAHRHGVIHRDIKPENLLLHEGQALIADFGIALALREAGGDRLTQTGLSLGTPQYMSPEQAAGDRVLDPRTDVYSLAAVLYESLAGAPPHDGPTVQAIIAKLLAEPVRPITQLRATIPVHVAEAIDIALAKLPADRFASAAEFAEALGGNAVPSMSGLGSWRGMRPAARWARDWRTLALGVVALVLGALAIRAVGSPAAAPAGPVRLTISAPPGTRFDPVWWASVDVTPDGRTIVFGARDDNGIRLYRRAIDDFRASAIEGTEDAMPFFRIAPGGTSVVYVTTGWQWKQADLVGSSPPVVLTTLPHGWNGLPTWSGDSLMVFPSGPGVFAIPVKGGVPAPLAMPDSTNGELRINGVVALPNGAFLLSLHTVEGPRVDVLHVRGQRARLEGLRGFVAAFLPPDRLLVVNNERWMLVRIDLERLQLAGDPVPVLDGVATGVYSSPSISPTGTLAYMAVRPGRGKRLVWVDRAGQATPLPVDPGEYRFPSLSPDGTRLAISNTYDDGEVDATVVDLASGGRIRIREPGLDGGPIWTASGRAVAFSCAAGIRHCIRSADGAGRAHTFLHGAMEVNVYQHLDDGSGYLADGRSNPPLIDDIFFLDAAWQPRPLIAEPGLQTAPQLSPDGRWLAYASDESGRMELYVQPYPALDRRWAISVDGASPAFRWSPTGRELFYLRGDYMMVASISTTGGFKAARPVELFRASRFYIDPLLGNCFDVALDGRFLMIEEDPDARVELRVEINAFPSTSAGAGPVSP